MSFLVTEPIDCPHCTDETNAEIWSIVNVQEDPELRDLLIGGELNMVSCEHCSKVFFAERFLIYHDSEAELMAFVYPFDHASERARWEEKTRLDFAQTQAASSEERRITYAPLTLFGMDELLRVVEEDEERSIQADIADLVARQQGLRPVRLAPHVARAEKMPPVLPLAGEASRASLIAGLDRLLAANDRLSLYAALRRRLDDEPSWTPRFA